jgi:MSHA biogenesis protein MshM
MLVYIGSRLTAAGYNEPLETLFSPKALKLLFKASRGIPRLINILCHKALLITYGYNKKKIDAAAIKMAITDTESIYHHSNYLLETGIILLSLLVLGIGIYFALRIFVL